MPWSISTGLPGQFHRNIQVTSGKEVYIINILGQVVKKVELKSNKVNIDVSDLQNGIYTLKIEDQGKLTAKTFIKME